MVQLADIEYAVRNGTDTKIHGNTRPSRNLEPLTSTANVPRLRIQKRIVIRATRPARAMCPTERLVYVAESVRADDCRQRLPNRCRSRVSGRGWVDVDG